jgi:hypothetical protein
MSCMCFSAYMHTPAARHHSGRSGSPMTRWLRNGTVLKIQKPAAGGDKSQLIQLCIACREQCKAWPNSICAAHGRNLIRATYMLNTSICALRHRRIEKNRLLLKLFPENKQNNDFNIVLYKSQILAHKLMRDTIKLQMTSKIYNLSYVNFKITSTT